MRRLILILIVCCLLPLAACAQEVLPQRAYAWSGAHLIRRYETDTLKYTVETANLNGCKIYVTKVWMQSPGKQIKKATATWRVNIQLPETMAAKIPGCALAINGSGYVSPKFPEIPDNYPGTSEDYFYTPLGSLTITDGEIFRNLAGVPYYGLTLEEDGLHLYVGADNEAVLANQPVQTWSFYEGCPMINDGVSILDREWSFATAHAARTMIAKTDANNYVIITATSSVGLTVVDATDFLLEHFQPEWAYDLDGGLSSVLICRKAGRKALKVIFGGKSKDADLMGFVELSE